MAENEVSPEVGLVYWFKIMYLWGFFVFFHKLVTCRKLMEGNVTPLYQL